MLNVFLEILVRGEYDSTPFGTTMWASEFHLGSFLDYANVVQWIWFVVISPIVVDKDRMSH